MAPLSAAAINTDMRLKCRSQNRCARVDCCSCARRHARRLTQRIHNVAPGNLYAIEIETPFCCPADFWSWRIEARNLIDYRRRSSRWWQRSGLHVWLGNDGGLRGIAALGELMPEEFMDAFNSHWQTTL